MTKAVQAVVGSIMIIGALTCSALLHSVCDLKSAQMNGQYSLIQEPMFCEFELSHNSVEATKNIYCGKGEGTVKHVQVGLKLWILSPCS